MDDSTTPISANNADCESLSGAFLYIICHHNKNGKPCAPIKIGITTNCATRLHDLQTGNHNRLHYYAMFPFPTKEDAALIERELHNYFSDECLSGEWFEVDPQNVIVQFMLYCGRVRNHLQDDIVRNRRYMWNYITYNHVSCAIIQKFIGLHENGWDMYERFRLEAKEEVDSRMPSWWLKDGNEEDNNE
ncbi:MAG TPA: hypothetical protein DCY07_04155 [Rhodospirillaceae bacterium]|nr:hypothetical protein [Rhodospirillaceae bacterium]